MKSFEVEPIIYERAYGDELQPVDSTDRAFVAHKVYMASKPKGSPKLSVCVLAYHHLDQTKRCIESILRYIGDIDYELILVDNASEDDNATLDYFQSVPVARKKIIQVSKPMGRYYGAIFGSQLMFQYAAGDIYLMVMNDEIFTKNAIQNLIACLESSPDIGSATPMASNTWMLQNPGITYSSYDEIFEIGEKINHYDPRKWEERMIVTLIGTAFKREALLAFGYYDYSWSGDEGVSNRLRMSGYRNMFLGDTRICHDHITGQKKDNHGLHDQTDIGRRMKENRTAMLEKTLGGMDQFEDVLHFEKNLTNMLNDNLSQEQIPDILAVDVRCGQGLLDVRNRLRNFGIFSSHSTAFTTKFKYGRHLYSVADEVFCDRIEFIDDSLAGRGFDYIIVGEPINMYAEPIKVLERLLTYLKPKGQLLFKVRNTTDLQSLQKMFGQDKAVDPEMPVHISVYSVVDCLKLMGINNIDIKRMVTRLSPENEKLIITTITTLGMTQNVNETALDIITQEYFLHVIKD